MDHDWYLDFNLSKDVFQQLLTASGGLSSLKQTLEILTESSGTVAGRTSLASRDILPAALHFTRSIPYPSARDYLLLSFKLLRNLCAGDPSNQNSFIDKNGVTTIANTLITVLQTDPDSKVNLIGLQVLANVSLAGKSIGKPFGANVFLMCLFLLQIFKAAKLVILYVCLFILVVMVLLNCIK